MDQDLIKAKLCSDFDESSLLNGLKHKKLATFGPQPICPCAILASFSTQRAKVAISKRWYTRNAYGSVLYL